MQNYKHLLLAVDFTSETAELAERAMLLRESCQARLSLAHVVEYMPMAYSGDLSLPDDFNLEQELAHVARQRMLELGERLGVAEANRYIAIGTPMREILRIAGEVAADLIIVGSPGRHGLAMLLGSTANSILHHAHCDVLAVRFRE
jgi:universal stress protein A